MIFNPDAIDYGAGVDLMPDGTIKARKIGCYVNTIEESNEIINKRQGEINMEIDESDKDPNYIPDRDDVDEYEEDLDECTCDEVPCCDADCPCTRCHGV